MGNNLGWKSIPLSAITAVLIYVSVKALFFPTPEPEIKTQLRVYEYYEVTYTVNGVTVGKREDGKFYYIGTDETAMIMEFGGQIEIADKTKKIDDIEYLYKPKTKEWVKYDVGTGKR